VFEIITLLSYITTIQSLALNINCTTALSSYLWRPWKARLPQFSLRGFLYITPPFPISSPEAPHVRRREGPLLAKGGIGSRNRCVKFSQTIQLPCNCWVLLHVANLRRGTDSFTYPTKDSTLRIFLPESSDGFSLVCTRKLRYQRPAC
jgi:hypothetical protein